MGVLVIGYAEVAAGSLGVAWEKVEEELVGSDCGQHAVATPNGWRVGGRAPACIRLGGNYTVQRLATAGKREGRGFRVAKTGARGTTLQGKEARETSLATGIGGPGGR